MNLKNKIILFFLCLSFCVFGQADSSTVHSLRELTGDAFKTTDHTGFPNKSLEELKKAAQDLKDILPATITGFKVFDYGSYPMLKYMGKINMDSTLFLAMQQEVEKTTQNYLLIGKHIDPKTGEVSFKVKLKLPVTGNKPSGKQDSTTVGNKGGIGQWNQLNSSLMNFITRKVNSTLSDEYSIDRNANYSEYKGVASLLEIFQQVETDNFLHTGVFYNPAGYPVTIISSHHIIWVDKIIHSKVPEGVVMGWDIIDDSGNEIGYEAQIVNGIFKGYLKYVKKGVDKNYGTTQNDYWGNYPPPPPNPLEPMVVVRRGYDLNCKIIDVKTTFYLPILPTKDNYFNLEPFCDVIVTLKKGERGYIDNINITQTLNISGCGENSVKLAKRAELFQQLFIAKFLEINPGVEIKKELEKSIALKHVCLILENIEKEDPNLLTLNYYDSNYEIQKTEYTPVKPNSGDKEYDNTLFNQNDKNLIEFIVNVFFPSSSPQNDDNIRIMGENLKNYFDYTRDIRKNKITPSSNLTLESSKFLINGNKLQGPFIGLSFTERSYILQNSSNLVLIGSDNKYRDICFLTIVNYKEDPIEAKLVVPELKNNKQLINGILEYCTLPQLAIIVGKLSNMIAYANSVAIEPGSTKLRVVDIPFDVKKIHRNWASNLIFDNSKSNCIFVKFEEEAYFYNEIIDKGPDWFKTGIAEKAELNPFDLILINSTNENPNFAFSGTYFSKNDNKSYYIFGNNNNPSWFDRYRVGEGLFLVPAMALFLESKSQLETDQEFVKKKVIPKLIHGAGVGAAIYFTGGTAITLLAEGELTAGAIGWLAFDVTSDYLFLSDALTPQQIDDYVEVYWAAIAVRLLKGNIPFESLSATTKAKIGSIIEKAENLSGTIGNSVKGSAKALWKALLNFKSGVVHNTGCLTKAQIEDLLGSSLLSPSASVQRFQIVDDLIYDFYIEMQYAGKTIKIKYTKQGFPDFAEWTFPHNGKKYVFECDNCLIGGKTGDPQDFNKANKALKKALGDNVDNFEFYPGSGFANKLTGERYVWHHHENTKTMIPLPQQVHSVASGSKARHTGGSKLLEKNIRDVGPDSPFKGKQDFIILTQ